MDPAPVSQSGHSSTEDLYRFLRNFDNEIIRRIAIKGAKYKDIEPVIIDLVQSIERAHITLSNEAMNQEELAMFNSKLFKLCSTYRENNNFSSQTTRFLNHRIRLKKSLLSNANELDRISFIIATARLFGCSLNLGMHLGGNVMEYLSKISPFLEYPFRCLLVTAAYFGPMCLITSFTKYIHSKYIVHRSINIVEEGKKLSNRLGISLLEKDNMQAIVTELFLETINEEFITSVESRSKYMVDHEKVFAAVLVSNMKKNPLCIKDGKFLCKTYLFSRTNAAKVWYNRMLSCIHLVDQENDIRVLEEELLHLKMVYYTSSQPYGILILILKSLNLPRFVLYGLYSMCLLCDLRNYKHGSNCMFSDDLRMLALHSDEFPQRITAYRKLKGLRSFVFLNKELFK
ncbi:hypothetical protein AVEN_40660-1 [Araneus ventricosus]|uniref:Uncharacterized protein n=1 Tax=Araneus ventricosus TaxID=182803 RepID=A0A4Y2H3R3_ARAVE|nr:hypothetical protein AVEN_40660-1 [Araneus ventricosus]